MRACCGMLAGLAALAACGSSSGRAPAGSASGTQAVTAAQTVARPPCGPATAHTLAQTTGARLYTARGGIYGCARHAHTSYRLGSSARSLREQRVEAVALAGVDAAYGLSTSGVDTSAASVVVRRLTDGRELAGQPATSGSVGPESVQSVSSVVLKPDGAVAWIAAASSIIHRGASDVEVNRLDSRGRSRLDSGAGIDQRSLRLRGSLLSWRHGQTARVTTLR